MNGLAVNSCLVLAPQADGSEVITLEGLAQSGNLHPLQRSFLETCSFQCGYCVSGMLLSCYALLLHNTSPNPEEIREAISGNLCRCTDYSRVVKAVQAATLELPSWEGELG